METLPHRVEDARPPFADRPVSLERLALVRGGRPLKRWRYVGVYGERLLLCAGVVRIGPLGQVFWAVWDRERQALRERTRLRRARGVVSLPRGVVRVEDGPTSVRLALTGGCAVETTSPSGDSWIWTRKTAGVRAVGEVVLGGETVAVDAPAVVDDTAGYHARDTAWEWSAGAGVAADGRAVAWNLVTGVHDAPVASERSVWVDGVPHEVAPVTFAADLSGVASADASLALAFVSEAVRARRDDLGAFASDYVQPFGAFTGTLGPGLELASGNGVMERHTARW
jgi:hypothetical protein